MSIPFGKWKKSPEQNASCFLGATNAYLDDKKGIKTNKKAVKKFEKYFGRMVAILNNKYKKWAYTHENLTHIATQCGKEADKVNRIFIDLDAFEKESKKQIIEIFSELFNMKSDPNPLAEGLASDAHRTIEAILDKFESSTNSTYYANILKMMSSKPELIKYFLDVKIFQVLANYASNSVFDISSEALTVFIEILFSENKKVQREVSNFLNEYKAEMMEIFLDLFNQDNYLAKREGMKMLYDLLLNKDYNREFADYFITEKEHLKFTMTSLNDESTPIQTEAFLLLLVFLQAPTEKRGPKVNDTLRKNKDQLIEFVQHFMEEKGKDDESLKAKKDIAIAALKDM